MYKGILFPSLLLFILAISQLSAQSSGIVLNNAGMTVESRVTAPDGFYRLPLPENSFQYYLQNLPVKTGETPVKIYNGYEKHYLCYSAVMDFDLLQVDLMHGEHFIQYLRSTYLYKQGKYDMIKHSMDDGRVMNFQQWADGLRHVWQDSIFVLDSIGLVSSSEESLGMFLQEVYQNSSSGGLSNDTRVLSQSALSIGDVFIQPDNGEVAGHSVIIVDMVVNPSTGEKYALLAQGFSPAQDMHILSNPYEPQISPWYRIVDDSPYFATAQWTFRQKHIRRFVINANAINFQESIEEEAED